MDWLTDWLTELWSRCSSWLYFVPIWSPHQGLLVIGIAGGDGSQSRVWRPNKVHRNNKHSTRGPVMLKTWSPAAQPGWHACQLDWCENFDGLLHWKVLQNCSPSNHNNWLSANFGWLASVARCSRENSHTPAICFFSLWGFARIQRRC